MSEVTVDKGDLDILQQAYKEQTAKNLELAQAMSGQSSAFGNTQDPNLIQWQLELDNILERIDHLLKGDELKFVNGNLIWTEPKNKDNILFNHYGVQEILRVLSMYLNRNTILSNYDEDTINWKVYDFSIEISDLIYNKYDEMFYLPEYDDPTYRDKVMSKIKLYPMIVRQIVDTVHSSYLRALNGGERQSLREARHVTQSVTGSEVQGGGSIPVKTGNNFKVYNPSTWFGK